MKLALMSLLFLTGCSSLRTDEEIQLYAKDSFTVASTLKRGKTSTSQVSPTVQPKNNNYSNTTDEQG
jgi:hypothetical protein